MALIVTIPQLSRRIRLPGAVGLLLSGVVFGPHMLDVFPREHPISEFFSELGMLLLMFFAGLEINLPLFRQKISRSIVFGVTTTSIPLLLGTLAAHWLGYGLLPALVVGSLLASHTLLAATIVARLGANRLEPIVVTFGATMISGTLSLLVFAICVPLYVSGFSASGFALQIIEIFVFVPLILFGLGRAGAYVLRKSENDEETYFVLMLGMIAVSAMLAQYINLPGIVGTFLAGLAVNAAVKDKPAKNKLEFMGNSLFIPIFFIVTGFLIDPLALIRSLTQDSFLAGGIIAALLVGKWIASRRAVALSATPPQHAERCGPSRCRRSRQRSRPRLSRTGPSMPRASRCSTTACSTASSSWSWSRRSLGRCSRNTSRRACWRRSRIAALQGPPPPD
jgi:Kef-type K+ transport system membrane component KefB